jgi:hypothetical protein
VQDRTNQYRATQLKSIDNVLRKLQDVLPWIGQHAYGKGTKGRKWTVRNASCTAQVFAPGQFQAKIQMFTSTSKRTTLRLYQAFA